jgi:LacI family transcriptional regulator
MPQSLICLNDDTALGALAACADRGLQVPSDLRVSGYDDTAAGYYGSVPLTTVRKPLDDLASTAVKMLIALVEEPETQMADVNTCLPGQIVVRRSTGTVDENSRLEAEGFFATSEVFEFQPEEQRQEAVAVS